MSKVSVSSRRRGFSLLELITVIAIVAILAGLSIPVYTKYSIRAQVSAALAQIQGYMQGAITKYGQTGAFPSSLNINGVNVPATVQSGTVTYFVNLPNISYVAYGVSTDGKAIYVQVTLTGNKISQIPGYVNGVSGPKALVALAWRDVSGSLVGVCGGYSITWISQIIPSAYLPPSCTCQDAGLFFATAGTSATCGASW